MRIPLVRTDISNVLWRPSTRSPMMLRPRSGRVYAKATRARQTGSAGVSWQAAVLPNRTLRMSRRRESHIAAMTDRLEPAQKAVHTGICRLAMVVVMSSGYMGWHYRAAPNAAAAVPDGELVKVAFTERRDVKTRALVRTVAGTRGRFRSRW
jgi:hypothetical protein